MNRDDRRPAWKGRVVALAAIAVILTGVAFGCGTARDRYQVLSFLFDGVPDPDAPPPPEPLPVPDGGDPGAVGAGAPDDGRSRHQPWVEKRCEACHGSKTEKRGSKFGSTGMGVGWTRCTGCHSKPEEVGERALVVREGTWQHGPVAKGNCRPCHAAHWSPFPHLLRKEKQEETCRSCHTELEARSGTMAGLDCVACHDPHLAAEQSDLLLRGGKAGNCALCHVLRIEERPWLHGPVSRGECDKCHDAHGGEGTENHVFRPLRERCFGCHRPEEVPTATTCDESRKCDACHDPHAAPSAGDMFLKSRIAEKDEGARAFRTRVPEDEPPEAEASEEQPGEGKSLEKKPPEVESPLKDGDELPKEDASRDDG